VRVGAIGSSQPFSRPDVYQFGRLARTNTIVE
jgi:hypothetical protein